MLGESCVKTGDKTFLYKVIAPLKRGFTIHAQNKTFNIRYAGILEIKCARSSASSVSNARKKTHNHEYAERVRAKIRETTTIARVFKRDTWEYPRLRAEERPQTSDPRRARSGKILARRAASRATHRPITTQHTTRRILRTTTQSPKTPQSPS
jgi:hypothetical protein